MRLLLRPAAAAGAPPPTRPFTSAVVFPVAATGGSTCHWWRWLPHRPSPFFATARNQTVATDNKEGQLPCRLPRLPFVVTQSQGRTPFMLMEVEGVGPLLPAFLASEKDPSSSSLLHSLQRGFTSSNPTTTTTSTTDRLSLELLSVGDNTSAYSLYRRIQSSPSLQAHMSYLTAGPSSSSATSIGKSGMDGRKAGEGKHTADEGYGVYEGTYHNLLAVHSALKRLCDRKIERHMRTLLRRQKAEEQRRLREGEEPSADSLHHKENNYRELYLQQQRLLWERSLILNRLLVISDPDGTTLRRVRKAPTLNPQHSPLARSIAAAEGRLAVSHPHADVDSKQEKDRADQKQDSKSKPREERSYLYGALVGLGDFMAMKAVEQYETKGMEVNLQPTKTRPSSIFSEHSLHLYGRYGVYPPTRSDYVQLFLRALLQERVEGAEETGWQYFEYPTTDETEHGVHASFSSHPASSPQPTKVSLLPMTARNARRVKRLKLSKLSTAALDVGTGSGILAFLLKIYGGVPTVIGTDINKEAVLCASANARHLRLRNVFFEYCDIFPVSNGADHNRYDFVVCNPPWMPPVSLCDEGNANNNSVDGPSPYSSFPLLRRSVFDEGDSNMVDKLFEGMARHLAPEGRVWLLYSNLACKLGLLQVKDEDKTEGSAISSLFAARARSKVRGMEKLDQYVQALCQRNGLRIIRRMVAPTSVKPKPGDPLRDVRASEKIFLFDICREDAYPSLFVSTTTPKKASYT
ncbi:methyltransferase small [Balamuthia mandrillaris]